MNPEGPANTLSYMAAGYAVIFTVLLGYITSLVLRQRRLKRELDTLREMEKESFSSPSRRNTVG